MEKTINQLYFGNYFFQAIFSNFVRWYLPVYFVIALGLSGTEIGILVSVGLLPTIMKPFFGMMIDKVGIGGQHRKPYIIIGFLIFVMNFIPFGLIDLKANIWFGAALFFGSYIGQAIIDTSIDAIALDNNRISSGKTLTFFALGSNLGGFVMMIIYFTIIQENITTGWWFGMYIAIILCGIPIFLSALQYADSPNWSTIKTPEIVSTEKSYIVTPRMKFLVVIFLFLMNSFALTEFLTEPYIVENHGTRAFSIFTVIVYTVSIAGIPLLFYLYKKRESVIYHKGKLIIIVGLFSMLYLLALASNNIMAIWIVSGIVVIVGVIQNFALMGILLAACPDKRRAMWYQFYAFIYALAALIWSSLGPILADIIGIQIIFYLIIGIYLPLLYIMPSIDKEFKKIVEEYK